VPLVTAQRDQCVVKPSSLRRPQDARRPSRVLQQCPAFVPLTSAPDRGRHNHSHGCQPVESVPTIPLSPERATQEPADGWLLTAARQECRAYERQRRRAHSCWPRHANGLPHPQGGWIAEGTARATAGTGDQGLRDDETGGSRELDGGPHPRGLGPGPHASAAVAHDQN